MTEKALISLSMLAACAAIVRAQPVHPALPSMTNAAALANAGDGATNALGPRIKFATPVADFGRVKSGEVVKYNYVFTNTGDRLLTLASVAPGCGCTTAGDWTKTVEPGRTGVIPIQLQTINFGGPVTKFITVTCDDSTQRSLVLQLKGTIWKPVEVNPPYANFTVSVDGQNTSTTLKITNNTQEPLILFPPVSNNGALSAELRTNTLGWGYDLVVTRLPPLSPGAISGQVTIKTSLTNTPPLLVGVWANVQPPLLVMPVQLALPQAPLAAQQTLTVTIQNFTTNTLVLSNPAVSDKTVGVDVREVHPGRYFNVMLTFPQGFEIPRNQQVEFSVKTSNPTVPLVKVPVMQMPRPIPPANLTPAASPANAAPPAARRMLPPPLPVPSGAVVH